MGALLQIQPKHENLADYVAFAKKHDMAFELIEMSMHKDIDISHVQDYANTGLVKSFHGVFIDVNPVSNNPAIRNASRNQMRESCSLAKRLGAENIVFHSSCFPFLRDSYMDIWASESAHFYDELQRSTGLNIFIENSMDVDMDPLRALMDRCQNPKVNVCLDLGHANFSRVDIGMWFNALADRIGYIHLSDNAGFFDRHKTLGSGTLDWELADTMFRRLGRDIPVTIEVNTLEQVAESLEFLECSNYFVGDASRNESEAEVHWDNRNAHESFIGELNERLKEENRRLEDTIDRYLSKEIVRHILESPKGLDLGGKKDHITVLMSDIRSFTAISERMKAQDLLAMLNHYLGIMTEIINRNNGTVIEFIGDGIMAIFGAPLECKNHALYAVQAAIDMQNAMDEINAWNAERGFEKLKMGIGIATGDMIIGNIGSTRHAKYGVIGSNVNLCGRIEGYTTAGQIYISPQTRDEISEPLEIEESIEIIPKGTTESITIHRITGVGSLSCKRAEEKLEYLAQPISVLFRRVAAKQVIGKRFEGRIIARSANCMLLETTTTLGRFDELQVLGLDSENLTFFKVTSINEGDGVYRIE